MVFGDLCDKHGFLNEQLLEVDPCRARVPIFGMEAQLDVAPKFDFFCMSRLAEEYIGYTRISPTC